MNIPPDSTTGLPARLATAPEGQVSGTASTLLSVHRNGRSDLRSHIVPSSRRRSC